MLAELGLRDVRQGVPVWGGALSANVVAAGPDGRGPLAFALAEDAMFSRAAYDGDGLGRPTGTLRATQRLLAAAGYRVRRAVSVTASGRPRPRRLPGSAESRTTVACKRRRAASPLERDAAAVVLTLSITLPWRCPSQVVVVPISAWQRASAPSPAPDAAAYQAQRDAKRAALLEGLLRSPALGASADAGGPARPAAAAEPGARGCCGQRRARRLAKVKKACALLLGRKPVLGWVCCETVGRAAAAARLLA